MAIQPLPDSTVAVERKLRLRSPKHIFLLLLIASAVVCLTLSWLTREAMNHLPFLKGRPQGFRDSRREIVDLGPWETARALAPLAVTEEEDTYARAAERLANEEVDQAFALALRQASSRHVSLTGRALDLSRRVEGMREVVARDQARVDALTQPRAPATTAKNGAGASSGASEIEVAKAQLALDTDRLNDAQRSFDRATGNETARIQQELAAHEASIQKTAAPSSANRQIALLSVTHYGTLYSRIAAWINQHTRYRLIRQAEAEAEASAAKLTAEHDALEAQAENASAPGAGTLAGIQFRSRQNEMLGIYDGLIQTQQQLAAVYQKWSAQVLLQRRIVVHLILTSLALIASILIALIAIDDLIGHLLDRPNSDQRRMHTLRAILKVGLQIFGVVVILLVVFGAPPQTPTIIGLVTAGLAVALQNPIMAFVGWFVLIGRGGIRVGDWVEINGVHGQVLEIGLFRTILLETGNWTDEGHPTGRRATFVNSFAIVGQYFNFSTSGQWMWDEISLTAPAASAGDLHRTVELIQRIAIEETEKDAQIAEQEWDRITQPVRMKRFKADPAVSLRPTGSGFEIRMRYITRAADRLEVRNRLYGRLMEVLDGQVADSVAVTKPALQAQ